LIFVPAALSRMLSHQFSGRQRLLTLHGETIRMPIQLARGCKNIKTAATWQRRTDPDQFQRIVLTQDLADKVVQIMVFDLLHVGRIGTELIEL